MPIVAAVSELEVSVAVAVIVRSKSVVLLAGGVMVIVAMIKNNEDAILSALLREGAFPADAAPQPGQVLTAQQENGQQMQLTITEVKEDAVTADANHPLAGEDLTFAVKLVEIKQAA